MKILAQNKNEILVFPKKIWTAMNGEKTAIVSLTATLNTIIGEYKNADRAKEVLNDMLDKYEAGEKIYKMPEE